MSGLTEYGNSHSSENTLKKKKEPKGISGNCFKSKWQFNKYNAYMHRVHRRTASHSTVSNNKQFIYEHRHSIQTATITKKWSINCRFHWRLFDEITKCLEIKWNQTIFDYWQYECILIYYLNMIRNMTVDNFDLYIRHIKYCYALAIQFSWMNPVIA